MSTHPPPGPAPPHELPPLSPMLMVIGSLPPPQTQGEYAYETLWNGARTIVHLPADGTVHLVSATGLDMTAQYPELQALAGLLPAVPVQNGCTRPELLFRQSISLLGGIR